MDCKSTGLYDAPKLNTNLRKSIEVIDLRDNYIRNITVDTTMTSLRLIDLRSQREWNCPSWYAYIPIEIMTDCEVR